MNISQDQQAIIALLTEIYLEIASIEQKFKLIAGKGDMRPRIDYFHDAIRAFTGGGQYHQRLSVELLSYDMRCLRYIEKMPLSSFRNDGDNSSPSQEVMNMDGDLISTSDSADRGVRARISELYQHYAIMFSALLKPMADRNYKERTSIINNDAKDISVIIGELENKADAKTITGMAQNLDEKELRIILSTFIQQKKHKNPEDIKKLLGHLKKLVKQKDAKIKAIDKAHMEFATTQLAVFEESKDMLKNLAAKGMNLIGKFVEASVADTRRQMGR
ncbi:MAG: hypothetical protein AABY33_05610 [Pseudomonadota bacterium]